MLRRWLLLVVAVVMSVLLLVLVMMSLVLLLLVLLLCGVVVVGVDGVIDVAIGCWTCLMVAIVRFLLVSMRLVRLTWVVALVVVGVGCALRWRTVLPGDDARCCTM